VRSKTQFQLPALPAAAAAPLLLAVLLVPLPPAAGDDISLLAARSVELL
jgi:hypothetical protein